MCMACSSYVIGLAPGLHVSLPLRGRKEKNETRHALPPVHLVRYRRRRKDADSWALSCPIGSHLLLPSPCRFSTSFGRRQHLSVWTGQRGTRFHITWRKRT